MNRSVYDDSPTRALVPMTSEEIDDLLLTDGSYFLRDPRRVRHLLTRMRAAFAYHVQQMRNLQRDIEQMHATARKRATPMSAALDALRQLSLDEQRQVFDVRAQVLIDAVHAAQSDAERARTAATSEANRARFALATVLQDEAVSAEVRDKVRTALLLLPDSDDPAGPSSPVAISHTPLPADNGGFVVAPAAPDADSGPGRGPDLSAALFGTD